MRGKCVRRFDFKADVSVQAVIFAGDKTVDVGLHPWVCLIPHHAASFDFEACFVGKPVRDDRFQADTGLDRRLAADVFRFYLARLFKPELKRTAPWVVPHDGTGVTAADALFAKLKPGFAILHFLDVHNEFSIHRFYLLPFLHPLPAHEIHAKNHATPFHTAARSARPPASEARTS